MKILLASDDFVTDEVMTAAITAEIPSAEFAHVKSTWPVPPFGDVGEVHEALGDEDELIAAAQGCEVIISHTFPFTEKVIAACPELKLISICRGGPVNVNIEAATRHGVMVSYAPGRNAAATAEHSVGMILAAMRQIAQRHMEVIDRQWPADLYRFEKVGPEVGASVVGVIGYGAVGRRVAKIMAAFGGTVLVYDPFAKDRQGAENIEFVEEIDDLYSRADVVTIHARVTPENHHMINAETIARMKWGAILVNCARGPLVDYDAVCDALESGQLYAAAFDCLPQEPLDPNSRLFEVPRVTITPHLAGASKEAARLAARIAAADIVAYSEGRLPVHLSNPEVHCGSGS